MMKKLFKNKMILFGVSFTALLILLTFIIPQVVPLSPLQQDLPARLSSPGAKHIMGTDALGRDVFIRIIYGARISLLVGFVSVTIALLIGVPLGLLAGFHGGWVDNLIMRIVDIMLCFPSIFLILMVITFLEPNIINVMAVIGLTSWPGLTRYVRGEALSVRKRDYISAAKMMNIGRVRILFIHMLPNVIAPVLITATLGIGSAILTESVLSFLGLGVQPPSPSWGNILTSGKNYMGSRAWWLILFPAGAIFLTVLSFNLIGEGLRDHLDPHKKFLKKG
ncbi:MAG: ABC transporter permease [Elusimicrobia bacterium]|jgi:peptide/nickel transport system permease protein|nr:ABC transporter permease [Elusimicrobiota bacterium]